MAFVSHLENLRQCSLHHKPSVRYHFCMINLPILSFWASLFHIISARMSPTLFLLQIHLLSVSLPIFKNPLSHSSTPWSLSDFKRNRLKRRHSWKFPFYHRQNIFILMDREKNQVKPAKSSTTGYSLDIEGERTSEQEWEKEWKRER